MKEYKVIITEGNVCKQKLCIVKRNYYTQSILYYSSISKIF